MLVLERACYLGRRNMWQIFKCLAKDQSAGPATEYALLVALVAAVAGFGMLSLGDSLGNFYDDAGTSFDTAVQFPSQADSQVIDGPDDPQCVVVDSNCIAGR